MERCFIPVRILILDPITEPDPVHDLLTCIIRLCSRYLDCNPILIDKFSPGAFLFVG